MFVYGHEPRNKVGGCRKRLCKGHIHADVGGRFFWGVGREMRLAGVASVCARGISLTLGCFQEALNELTCSA